LCSQAGAWEQEEEAGAWEQESKDLHPTIKELDGKSNHL
jgi:hypothetical protein